MKNLSKMMLILTVVSALTGAFAMAADGVGQQTAEATKTRCPGISDSATGGAGQAVQVGQDGKPIKAGEAQ